MMSSRTRVLAAAVAVAMVAGCGEGPVDRPATPVSQASTADRQEVTLHLPGMCERLKLL